MLSRRAAIGTLAVGVPSLLASARKASALDFPTRPVRFLVGYPPGGATDILARLIGQRLSEKLGQQFVIENKPGAGNNIGTEAAVNAEPDGYTVMLINPANFINATPVSMTPWPGLGATSQIVFSASCNSINNPVAVTISVTMAMALAINPLSV